MVVEAEVLEGVESLEVGVESWEEEEPERAGLPGTVSRARWAGLEARPAVEGVVPGAEGEDVLV